MKLQVMTDSDGAIIATSAPPSAPSKDGPSAAQISSKQQYVVHEIEISDDEMKRLGADFHQRFYVDMQGKKLVPFGRKGDQRSG